MGEALKPNLASIKRKYEAIINNVTADTINDLKDEIEGFEASLRSLLKDAIEDKECMDSISPDFYKGCGLAEESHHQEIIILKEILGDV